MKACDQNVKMQYADHLSAAIYSVPKKILCVLILFPEPKNISFGIKAYGKVAPSWHWHLIYANISSHSILSLKWKDLKISFHVIYVSSFT